MELQLQNFPDVCASTICCLKCMNSKETTVLHNFCTSSYKTDLGVMWKTNSKRCSKESGVCRVCVFFIYLFLRKIQAYLLDIF